MPLSLSKIVCVRNVFGDEGDVCAVDTGRPGGSSDQPRIILVFESWVRAPGGSDI